MKFPWTLVTLMVTICLLAVSKKTNAYPLNSDMDIKSNLAEEAIKSRLQTLDLPFAVEYTEEVNSLIQRYAVAGYKGTQHILGRSVLYFPIFEHYLKVYDLPIQLKYLPIVESRLRPQATSSVGAAGLWQFMPVTAKQYKLKINEYLDERRDPYKSTEAAVKMLSDLYEQFEDWSLVLAAYNCGPGRVRKAIRYAGCNNFWEIRKFLPQETQKYVPAFIAAAYIENFYSLHDLAPNYPTMAMQNTRTVITHQYMAFRDIAYKCSISEEILTALNPSYVKGVIPTSYTGNYVILPKKAVKDFKAYDAKLAKKSVAAITAAPYGTFLTHHVVNPGERIETLAKNYHCSIAEIVAWNELRKPEVVVGQELTLYLSKNIFIPRP